MTDGVTWKDELSDKSSPEYQNLSTDVRRELTDFYKNQAGFRNITNIEFSQGSVVTIFILEFDPSTPVDTANLTNSLRTHIHNNGGKLGNFTVNQQELYFEEVTGDDDDSGVQAWIIATAACGGVVFLLAVFMISVLCTRRSSNRKYTLDGEDPEDLQYKRSWASGSQDGTSSSRSLQDYDNAALDHYAPPPGVSSTNYDMQVAPPTGARPEHTFYTGREGGYTNSAYTPATSL